MNTLLVAASSALLFLAPFAGSAGLRAAMLIIAVLVLVSLRGRGLLDDFSRLPRALVISYAAWALLCVASLAWSVRPAHTLSELRAELLYGTLALAFFLIAASDAARWRTWWLALVTGTLTVMAAMILQQLISVPLSRHALEGGPGAWSTHLVLIAPLLLALAWPPPWGQGGRDALQALAIGVVLLAAWETGNRIVWLAFGAQLATVVLLHRTMPPPDGARRRHVRILAVMASVVVVVAFGASIVERNNLHFSAKAPVTTSLERDVRPQLWAAAWEQYKRAPWLGHGFGREILEDKFEPLTPRTADHPVLRHAHNLFIDMALQVGALGLAAFVLVIAAMARQYARYLRDPMMAPLGIIGIALLVGFIVKSLTDDFLHRHNAVVFWALNGMLLGLGVRRKPVS